MNSKKYLSSFSSCNCTFEEISILKLSDNPYYPRISSNIKNIEALTLSIKEHGMLQPIIVSYDENTTEFILLDGHQRVSVHQILGNETIKALIYTNISKKELASLPIVLNKQSNNISSLEYGIIFKKIFKENLFSSDQELATKLAVDKSWVSTKLKAIKFSKELIETIASDKYHNLDILKSLNTLDQENIVTIYEKY